MGQYRDRLMPLVTANISHVALAGIKALVESGKYLSFENFLEIAAFNQLALEKSGGADLKGVAATSRLGGTNEKKLALSRPKRRSAGRIKRQVYVLDKQQQESFEPIVAPFEKVKTNSPLPAPPAASSLESFEHQRIFGLVNRLLPLKLVCRWVLRNASSRSMWPGLSEINEALANDTARLGSLLELQDISKARKRDDCRATGLPRQGNAPSKDRFLGQFVARVTRSGHVFPGAVCQYGLATISVEALGLSSAGMIFAQIENPILDGRLDASEAGMSNEETQFLLRHIKETVPQEQADIDAILRAIASGSSTPTSLTQAVRPFFPAEWNDGEMQTHVSGLIGRMSELNLLHRRWHGRHVEYELRVAQQAS
jgi:hypothetical protein